MCTENRLSNTNITFHRCKCDVPPEHSLIIKCRQNGLKLQFCIDMNYTTLISVDTEKYQSLTVVPLKSEQEAEMVPVDLQSSHDVLHHPQFSLGLTLFLIKYLLMIDKYKYCSRTSISIVFYMCITCGIPKLQMCWRCERITVSSLSIRSYWFHTRCISWAKNIIAY